MTKITELMENATREELLAALTKIAALVEPHEEVQWEAKCPDHLIGDYDDTWDWAQNNGESYMANQVEGLIRSSLNQN